MLIPFENFPAAQPNSEHNPTVIPDSRWSSASGCLQVQHVRRNEWQWLLNYAVIKSSSRRTIQTRLCALLGWVFVCFQSVTCIVLAGTLLNHWQLKRMPFGVSASTTGGCPNANESQWKIGRDQSICTSLFREGSASILETEASGRRETVGRGRSNFQSIRMIWWRQGSLMVEV